MANPGPDGLQGIAEVGISRTITSSIYKIRTAVPLTTVYTYPSSCLSRWVQPYPNDVRRDELYSDAFYGSQYLKCQPGTTTRSPIYSPGVCPYSMTVATIIEVKTLPDFDDFRNRQWQAVCCGIGFVFSEDFCTSSFTSTAMTAYRPSLSSSLQIVTPDGSSSIRIFTFTNTNYDVTTNTTTLRYGTLLVAPLLIVWEASDLPKFEPRYASALAARLGVKFTATATASPNSNELSGLPRVATPSATARIPAPTESLVAVDAQGNRGLSTAAKAGIGVGAFFALLFWLALGFFIYRCRKRKMLGMDGSSPAEIRAAEAPELIEVRKSANRAVMTANVVAA